MPEVAFVEFPPQKADLSSSTHLAPCSSTVLAAAMPPRPPPSTITQSLGKIVAIFFDSECDPVETIAIAKAEAAKDKDNLLYSKLYRRNGYRYSKFLTTKFNPEGRAPNLLAQKVRNKAN